MALNVAFCISKLIQAFCSAASVPQHRAATVEGILLDACHDIYFLKKVLSVYKCNREGDLYDLTIKTILNFMNLAVASKLGLNCACVLKRFNGFVKGRF